MRNEDFEELLASVKEAGVIKRGEIVPSRVFKYDAPRVVRIET